MFPYIFNSSNAPAEYPGLPGNWSISSTPSGFMNTDEMYDWFMGDFLPGVNFCKRPLVLILDNHVSHENVTTRLIDDARAQEVHFLFLPPNTSLKLQPLDCGFFHILKQKVEDICANLGYAGATTVPRQDIPRVIYQAYQNITPLSISGGFKNTGIFPFDSTKVKAFPHQTDNTNHQQADDDIEPVPCELCHHLPPKENPLVRTGVISADLADLLVPPPPAKKKRATKRKPLKARVVVPAPLFRETLSVENLLIEPSQSPLEDTLPSSASQHQLSQSLPPSSPSETFYSLHSQSLFSDTENSPAPPMVPVLKLTPYKNTTQKKTKRGLCLSNDPLSVPETQSGCIFERSTPIIRFQ